MTLPRGTRILSSPGQIEAVSSPLRIEVLEHLRLAGPASVADLGRLMGRSATALHYHVNRLRSAGLLREAGRRAAGKRKESVYRLAAERFAVLGRPSSPGSLRIAARTLGATLRLAHREASRALLTGLAGGHGPNRNFHTRRLRAPLSAAARGRVNRLLDELERIFFRELKRQARRARGRGPGAPPAGIAALTFLLAPASGTRKEAPR